MDIERKLQIARAQCLMDFPFFGHLLLSMPIKENNSISTFAVDGKFIYYNGEFIQTLGMDDLKFVLMHETMHPAFFHLTRRGTRDHTIWNMAGDYVINRLLVDEGMKPPADVLLDEKYDKTWNTDMVYDDLIKNAKRIKIKGLGDMPCTGHFEDGEGQSEGEKSETENKWKTKIIAASNACSKNRGTIPGHFKELINEIRNPKVDWRDKLYALATEPMRDEHSWRRPNRRFIGKDLYLPSITKIDGLRKIIFAVDTSGSMNTDLLIEAWSEIVSVVEDCDVDELIIMDVDTDVNHIRRFSKDDLPDALEVVGRGGTAFEPTFDWVIENDEDPAVLIYFTDLYGSFPQYEPDYPVIWVNYGAKDTLCPFGEVITIE